MNLKQRRFLIALRRRLDFLSHRISTATARGKDLSYDKQERAALRWAIESLDDTQASALTYPQECTSDYFVPASSPAVG